MKSNHKTLISAVAAYVAVSCAPQPAIALASGIALPAAVAAVSAAAPKPAQAQTLKVATGSAKGTYSTMFKELVGSCGTDVALVDTPSTGSMDNINLLVENKVNAAFVQADVLYLRARTEELGNVKTLLALHKEQIHLVSLANPKLSEGGVMGIGSKQVVLTDLAHLAGRRVVAAGGSAVTAQVLRLQSEVPFNVVPVNTNDEALAAIREGKAEAGLFVGGAPLPILAALDTQFRLLSIAPVMQERLKGVYSPARLNYSRMGSVGIPTVATDALFVTREYKTPKVVNSLAKFRQCALSTVDELKETTGTHPAWQGVDVNNRGKWPWLDLPKVGK